MSTDDSMVAEIGGSPRGRAVGTEDTAIEVAQREISALHCAAVFLAPVDFANPRTALMSSWEGLRTMSAWFCPRATQSVALRAAAICARRVLASRYGRLNHVGASAWTTRTGAVTRDSASSESFPATDAHSAASASRSVLRR